MSKVAKELILRYILHFGPSDYEKRCEVLNEGLRAAGIDATVHCEKKHEVFEGKDADKAQRFSWRMSATPFLMIDEMVALVDQKIADFKSGKLP